MTGVRTAALPPSAARPLIVAHPLVRAVSLYGLCTALMRGAPLLCLPLLTRALTLGEFGLYSLAQVVAQLALPLLSLNGAAAVEREGATDRVAGSTILRGFMALSIVATVSVALATRWVDTSFAQWVTFAVVLAGIESVHLLGLSWFRVTDQRQRYAVFTVIKVAGLVVLLAAAAPLGWGLATILLGQAMWYAAVALLLLPLAVGGGGIAPLVRAVRGVLPYTLPLIPHTAAQWVMSGSDRLVIRLLIDNAAVGLYSIGYTLGSVLLLANSGIALALPPFMFRDYARWLERDRRSRFLAIYSAGAVALVAMVQLALEFDRRVLGWIGTYSRVLPLIVVLVAVGLYLLGIYLLYTSVLAYRRRTGRLAAATAIAAAANVALTVPLVAVAGPAGAAVATMISYALYLLLVARAAHQVEPALEPFTLRARVLATAGVIVMLSIGVFQAMWWPS